MKYLSEKGLTVKETEKLLVGNELVLISQKDSKLQNVDIAKGEWVNQLKDTYLSVGDPAHVPAGQYAEEALTKLNLWDKVKDKLARAKDVRAALALVELWRISIWYRVCHRCESKQRGESDRRIPTRFLQAG